MTKKAENHPLVFPISRFVALTSLCLTLHSSTGRAENSSYRVSEDLPTLGEISIYLYGTTAMAKKIAQWNHLRKPYKLRAGLLLKLKKSPSISNAKGHEILLAMWRKRMDLPPLPMPEPIKIENEVIATPTNTRKLEEAAQILEQEQQQEEVQEFAPPDTCEKSRFDKAEKLFEKGEYEPALDVFTRCCAVAPEVIPAWFYRFQILKQQKREVELKTAIDELIKIHPEFNSMPVIKNYLGKTDEN